MGTFSVWGVRERLGSIDGAPQVGDYVRKYFAFSGYGYYRIIRINHAQGRVDTASATGMPPHAKVWDVK